MNTLEYKPDFEDARRHWEAFWAGEIIDRPCICIVAPKDGRRPAPHPPGLHHPDDDLLGFVRAYDQWARDIYFGGDAVPFFFPNFGPDVYAAFMGAELEFAPAEGTSWALPFVEDWRRVTAGLAEPSGRWWDAALDYVTKAREAAQGRFGVAMLDLHSNLDCLAAIRGPQQLCLDLADRPDEIEEAMSAVRRSYAPVYDALFHASGEDETGSSTWLAMYSPGKFSSIQCDFICMIGPEHLRRFVMPALEEEARFLDHCCYHYDGPSALHHLSDILSIEAIEAIQWVPGAGNAPHVEWMDLYRSIQDHGKSVHIPATVDEVKVFHRQLRPERVVYDVSAASESEAREILDWLVRNT